MTYLTYSDSVLAAADDNGCLSPAAARRLMADHGFTLSDVAEDSGGQSCVALAELNAEALLTWLGY
ncbi:MAG: hypothetical protein EBZ51_09450 [Synechococcaceae bacterium WB9_2_112]|nr:hypothetical protein [Synechococcaceae bacterium WB9_2_112]